MRDEKETERLEQWERHDVRNEEARKDTSDNMLTESPDARSVVENSLQPRRCSIYRPILIINKNNR